MKRCQLMRQWNSFSCLDGFKSFASDLTLPVIERILRFCKSGSIGPAVILVNSLNTRAISNKPLVYASLLQTCSKVHCFSCGIQVHAQVLKLGLQGDRFVGNCLLSLYFRLSYDTAETRRVFDELVCRDDISWSSMISAYLKAEKPRESIELFREMLRRGVEPNGFSLSAAIKASADDGNFRCGWAFHVLVFVRGFDSNCVICGSLIHFYGKTCQVDDARKVFDEISVPDPICWTTIVSAYTKNEMYDKAVEFFLVALRRGTCLLDDFTFGTVLAACGNLGRLQQGKEVHGKIIVSGFSGSVVLESCLVDMYGKLRLMHDSRKVFDRMSSRNFVSWSALLDGYRQNEDFESVLVIFREMEEFDLYSFGTILGACAGLAAVRLGKEVHCQYVRRGGHSNVIIESALVDLYAKCGCIDFAYRVFQQMPDRNLITWNTMINGFAMNGRPDDARELFHNLISEGIRPDQISFLGVLSGCTHSMLVQEGRKHFRSMREDYEIEPLLEHYHCIIDLLGRAGLYEEAEDLIMSGDHRDDSSLWVILLGSCADGQNSAVAERIAKKTMELKPDYYVSYVYLANLYKALGRWEDARKIWILMHERGVLKIPGKSWIDSHRGDSVAGYVSA